MAITLTEDGQFFDTAKDAPMGIFAKRTKGGRWQYRMDSHEGRLVASNTPPRFIRQAFLDA